MKRSYDELAYHVVFATKYRQHLISPDLDNVVQEILREACQMVNAHVYAIGTADDHAHLLLSFPVGTDVPRAIGRIKGRSSFYISRSCDTMMCFAWQRGYGIFTVSKRAVPVVKRYVLSQRRRHGTALRGG
jgi:REP element-mobilizing transposase RayT